MNKQINICKKDEAYSFDEIAFVIEGIESSELIEKLQSLLNAIGENKKSKAVFFMPLQSFNIFVLFQGDNSICEITGSDIEKIMDELKKSAKPGVKLNQAFSDSLVKKMKVLLDYMNGGEGIKPVCIQADNFSEITILT